MTATLSLGASMAADWPTYPARKAPAVTMQHLAAEAAELRPAGDGALVTLAYMAEFWQIDVHVTIPEALDHCDRIGEMFGVISVKAGTFDAAVVEAMRRVEAAIADTPAHIIAY